MVLLSIFGPKKGEGTTHIISPHEGKGKKDVSYVGKKKKKRTRQPGQHYIQLEPGGGSQKKVAGVP